MNDSTPPHTPQGNDDPRGQQPGLPESQSFPPESIGAEAPHTPTTPPLTGPPVAPGQQPGYQAPQQPGYGTPQQAYGQPQQAYGQPQQAYVPPQAGMPMAQPAYGLPSSPKGLAVTTLVVGIVAFLSGWLPVVGIILGAVAVLFGVIALVKKQSKALALTGLILGAVGLVTSIIFTVIAGAFTTAVLTGLEEGSKVTVEDDSATGSGQVGSETNPVALGTSIKGTDFEVVVNSVTLGADEAVLAANPINTAAEAGMQYAVVNLTITYTGPDNSVAAFVTTEFRAPDGEEYYTSGNAPVAPEPGFALQTLNPGDSETANTVLQIPADGDGLIGITPGLVADTVYVKLS